MFICNFFSFTLNKQNKVFNREVKGNEKKMKKHKMYANYFAVKKTK